MKKANEYTQKDVARRAYSIIYGIDNLLFQKGLKRARLDRRYNFSNDVVSFFLSHQINEAERQRILALKKERSFRKYFCTPPARIFDLPIIKDYMNNKNWIKGISEDGLHFVTGRNHWAKTAKDRRILSILKKSFHPAQ